MLGKPYKMTAAMLATKFNKAYKLIIILIFFIFTPHIAMTEELNVYKVNFNKTDEYKVIKKGSVFPMIVSGTISSKDSETNENVKFKIPLQERSIKVSGTVSKSVTGGRLSKNGQLSLSSNKLILEDGREINFPASSIKFTACHPPHASNGPERLGRLITRLAAGSSPATFGIGLGASFLIGGLLSARLNGPQDFIWGGFDGAGFPIVEKLLRKQPDVSFPDGAVVTFTTANDIKINQGIKKEQIIKVDLSHDQAKEKIDQLLKWNDLAGAIELAKKTGEDEIYNELVQKVATE